MLRCRLGPALTTTPSRPDAMPRRSPTPDPSAYASMLPSWFSSVLRQRRSVVFMVIRVFAANSRNDLEHARAASPRRARLGGCSSMVVPIIRNASKPVTNLAR